MPPPLRLFLGTLSAFCLTIGAGPGSYIGEPLTFIGRALALVSKALAFIGQALALVGQVLAPVSSTLAPLQKPLLMFHELLPKLKRFGRALASGGKRFAFLSYSLSLPGQGFALLSPPLALTSGPQQLIQIQAVASIPAHTVNSSCIQVEIGSYPHRASAPAIMMTMGENEPRPPGALYALLRQA